MSNPDYHSSTSFGSRSSVAAARFKAQPNGTPDKRVDDGGETADPSSSAGKRELQDTNATSTTPGEDAAIVSSQETMQFQTRLDL